ncbi:MAG: hypothetical protein ACYTF1_05495 [Planctomycetota bacterium]|jgi:uncharacterized paraquat-inducible protein A
MIRKAIILILVLLMIGTLLISHIEKKYILVLNFDDLSITTLRGQIYAKYFYAPSGMLRFYVLKGQTRIHFDAPFWILLAAFAAYPLYVAANQSHIWWQKRQRKRLGHCLNCGYNLTGNTSGICPECGKKIC